MPYCFALGSWRLDNRSQASAFWLRLLHQYRPLLDLPVCPATTLPLLDLCDGILEFRAILQCGSTAPAHPLCEAASPAMPLGLGLSLKGS